jgi:hypothetical protein
MNADETTPRHWDWFVPPAIVPALLTILIVAYAFVRQ